MRLTEIKRLYEKGYSRENILQLFRLIDWMMTLPKELEQAFDSEISGYEGEQTMPYITSVERLGMMRNQRENLIEILATRFGEVPVDLIKGINSLYDISLLKQLFKQAIAIPSVAEFKPLLAEALRIEQENTDTQEFS